MRLPIRPPMGLMIRFVIALFLALAAGAATAEPVTARFYGYAYDLESGKYLYTEVHEQRIDGDRWLSGAIRYLAPDGSELGYKTLDFSSDPFIPVYRMDLKAGGYAEGISAVTAESIEMFKKGYGEKQATKVVVRRKGPATADSGFHAFLRSNMAALVDGKTLNFRFVAAGNLDQFQFRARRVGEATFDGIVGIRLRVEPDSFLRLLVDPLSVVYDPKLGRLLEYRGVSNVHDPATSEAYNVRIGYYLKPPADAPKLPPLDPA